MQAKTKNAPVSGQVVAMNAAKERNRFARNEGTLSPLEASLKSCVSFAVLERQDGNGKTWYQVSRIDWKDGLATIVPLKEAIVYEALAYIMLYEQVGDFYTAKTIAAAAPQEEGK